MSIVPIVKLTEVTCAGMAPKYQMIDCKSRRLEFEMYQYKPTVWVSGIDCLSLKVTTTASLDYAITKFGRKLRPSKAVYGTTWYATTRYATESLIAGSTAIVLQISPTLTRFILQSLSHECKETSDSLGRSKSPNNVLTGGVHIM